uniref:Uncharacterized protein n=1 Tax=Rangifer tarandus platyrhynchus TaxID=3082113 RepID=A0ACB0ET11_RANTA|nr:unnamed protein product [Rangifer tarandus platyrhynchus]
MRTWEVHTEALPGFGPAGGRDGLNASGRVLEEGCSRGRRGRTCTPGLGGGEAASAPRTGPRASWRPGPLRVLSCPAPRPPEGLWQPRTLRFCALPRACRQALR